MKIEVIGERLPPEEIEAYKRYVQEKNPDKKISKMTLKPDGEYIDIDYEAETVPFERIRRITGYLVGSLDRFNDAKLAEEADRVKHDIEAPEPDDAPVLEM